MATRMNLRGIASYPHLAAPRRAGRPGHQQGDPKYSVVVILDDSNDWAALDAAMKQAIAETFPNGWPNGGRWPLKQYTEQDAPRPDLVGKTYVNCGSLEKVPVFDVNVTPVEPDGIYPGAIIEAAVAIAGYNNAGQGITFFLNAVRKLGDGPRLDDRPDPASLFQPTQVQNAPG